MGAEALTTAEQAQATTLCAYGWSTNRIALRLHRSRHTIKKYLESPDVKAEVRDEKAELAELCKEKARAIIVSIDDADIAKANLLQKATASAILLDKSLLLAGEAIGINVTVLLDAVQAIREKRDGQVETRALPLLGTQ
jgi:hypothetical protein